MTQWKRYLRQLRRAARQAYELDARPPRATDRLWRWYDRRDARRSRWANGVPWRVEVARRRRGRGENGDGSE